MKVPVNIRQYRLKHIFIGVCLAYGAGIFAMEGKSTYIVLQDIGIVLLAAFIKLIISSNRRSLPGILLAVCFAAGGVAVHITGDATVRAPYQYVEKYVTVTGRICEPPQIQSGVGRYVLNTRTCSYLDETVPLSGKLAVSCYEPQGKRHYQYGDVIAVSGFIGLPKPPLNEGDVDYVKWYKTQKVYFEMESDYDHSQRLLGETYWYKPADLANRIRSHCIAVINRYLPQSEAALARAMLLNDQSGLSAETKKALQISGLYHMAVASGMHVSGILMILTWLLLAFGFNRKWICIIGMAAVGMLALVLGLSASILRAAIMASVYLLAIIFGREEDRFISLFGSALVLMLLNPYVVFDAGAQLSFLSVLGIFTLLEPIKQLLLRFIKIKWICDGIAVTAAVQLFLAPVLAYYFGYVPTYVLLSNLLVSPVVILVMGAGIALLAASAVCGAIAHVAAGFLYVLLTYIGTVSSFIAKLPFAQIGTPRPGFNFFLIYFLLLYALYAILHNKPRISIVTACSACAGVFAACVIIAAGMAHTLTLTFINVGHGDAALIHMPQGKTMIIDGGGSAAYSQQDLGEMLFIPYLKRRGLDKLDIAVVSHYDKDHVQGVAAALRHFEVSELILPRYPEGYQNAYKTELETLAAQSGTRVHYVTDGMYLDFGGGVSAKILSPTVQIASSHTEKENNRSIVLKLSYGDMDVLFTGDIEKQTEQDLVKRGAPLDAEVLKVAHHGSKTSSSPDFVRAVSPALAVISTGEGMNPADADRTEALLTAYGAQVLRTDKNGDITMKIQKTQIDAIDLFRRTARFNLLYARAMAGAVAW